MNNLTKSIENASQSDTKLILIVGKPGSGKSKIIHNYSKNTGIPIVDFTKILSENADDLKNTMKSFLKSYRFDVLLIDNKKALYNASNDTDLKEILDDLAKDIIVVSTWNGFISSGSLTHIVNDNEIHYPLDGSFTHIIVS